MSRKRFILAVIALLHLLLFLNVSWAGDGDKKWEFITDGPVYSSPAIGTDGTIYVGSGDSKLYAINPDGTKKGVFATGGGIYSSPAIGADGTIYIGSDDKKLYAINPDGTKKWVFTTDNMVRSSPSIGNDGTIYVGSNDNNLYAINPDGAKKWEFPTGDMVRSSPIIGIDGTIYVGSNDGKLYAVNPDGIKKWEFDTGRSISSSPSIGSDKTIYVGAWGNKLYAINPDGTKKWEFTTVYWIESSPAISTDGTVYVGSDDYRLYAINPDGTKKWEFVAGNRLSSSPAIGSDGTIYIGSNDNKVYAIKPDGIKKWEFSADGLASSSPVIGLDGTLYIGSYDRKLYAIHTDSGGLANSPWPMFHYDTKHTGRMEQKNFPALLFSFGINDGEIFTNSRAVNLDNVAVNNPVQYMASENINFTGAKWLAYSPSPSFILSSGCGIKTVYFKIKNAAGESNILGDSIGLLTSPTLASFSINNGSATTTSQTVILNNTATCGPTHYMASEDADFSGASWQTYSAEPDFTLGGGEGIKTVYFKLKNIIGESNVRNDNIELKLTKYYINTTAGEGGSISPSGKVEVKDGSNQTFAITPSEGYYILDVKVDGSSVGAAANYNFQNVTSNHTIEASFKLITYFITATAGEGGTISPSGKLAVDYGKSQELKVTPSGGYHISSVKLDGVNINSPYMVEDVKADHTIEATFQNDPPSVTLDSIKGIQHSDCIINYHLKDTEKDTLGIICEYSRPIDSRWYPASVEGIVEKITEGNYDGQIIWKSRKDIPSTSGMDIGFRITPKDSQYEGNPAEIAFHLVNILADYDDNGKIDDLDGEVFRKAWYDQDISKEIGPAAGVAPDLIPQPDGVIDFEDLAVFSLMWIWSNGTSASPLMQLIPINNALLQNYPNPFNPETWIPYQLKEDGDVTISIYSVTGQLVRIFNLGHKPVGFYIDKSKALYWDGKNEAGEYVAYGTYFYSIKAGDFISTRKMILIK